jgi:uncharacterized pyridoxamine 5'-phosphate oxidase family protein
MMEGKMVSVDLERVRKVIDENPGKVSEILLKLFPEVKDEEKVFCRIGSLFTITNNPKNIYALFKWNGEVRILNVTGNYMWKRTSMKVSMLQDPHGETMTVGEFKRLVHLTKIDIFNFNLIVEKPNPYTV